MCTALAGVETARPTGSRDLRRLTGRRGEATDLRDSLSQDACGGRRQRPRTGEEDATIFWSGGE